MTKRTSKPKGEDKTKAAAKVTGQIAIESRPDTPSYYANYVAVSHTPYDFTLSVAKVPSPLTSELMALAQQGKPMPMEALLQIVLPPLLIDGLIKALIDQKEKHAKTLQLQVENNEREHQHIKVPSSIN
ncbi:MAG: hypothetical protein ACRD4R_00920 [Candidatus Acidiferrales bacterium]